MMRFLASSWRMNPAVKGVWRTTENDAEGADPGIDATGATNVQGSQRFFAVGTLIIAQLRADTPSSGSGVLDVLVSVDGGSAPTTRGVTETVLIRHLGKRPKEIAQNV